MQNIHFSAFIYSETGSFCRNWSICEQFRNFKENCILQKRTLIKQWSSGFAVFKTHSHTVVKFD